MNLHVHSAHRQRKSLGCEHNKRVEKRWRITCADIRPGVYGPLVSHSDVTSPFPPSGNGGYASNRDVLLIMIASIVFICKLLWIKASAK